MIINKTIEHLKNLLEEQAEITFGKKRTFVIFEEVGERASLAFDAFDERTSEEIESIVYGTLYSAPSSLLPMAGTLILTYNTTLELICEKDVSAILETVNTVATSHNGEVLDIVDGEHTYSLTYSFSPAVCGEWAKDISFYGEIVPVRMNLSIVAVKDGISSNSVKIDIDGHEVNARGIVFTRAKTMTARSYEADGAAKNTIEQHAFEIAFTCPVFNNDIGNIILEECENGSLNAPHTVGVKIGQRDRKEYACVFGNSTINVEAGANISAQVSLVEKYNDLEPIAEVIENG